MPSALSSADHTPLFNPATVSLAPEDPLYGLVQAYESDKSDKKVDLGVGAYRDDNGKPWILPVVKKVNYVWIL